MPIFLSCFSAGSAGSSPTSSQNATLPSSSAWPLSASGYSSSFSSIASAPSIAGTKNGLPTFTFLCILRRKKEKKGPRKCCPCYYSGAAIGRSTLCSPVRGRQHFWRFCWGALYAMPGSVLRKMYLFHLMPNAITLYWHWGVVMTISIATLQRNVLFFSNRVTAEVLDPSSESWCHFFVHKFTANCKISSAREKVWLYLKEDALLGNGGWTWGSVCWGKLPQEEMYVLNVSPSLRRNK